MNQDVEADRTERYPELSRSRATGRVGPTSGEDEAAPDPETCPIDDEPALTEADRDSTAAFEGLDSGLYRATQPAGRGRACPDLPGSIGRYRVLDGLGHGSFGAVYLAFDDQLDRRVAIKVQHPAAGEVGPDDQAMAYEARILARLDHEAIVPIYDVGRLDDGRPFIVSKYIDGSNLALRLREGRAPREIVARWVSRAAEGLHFAHVAGVIHRDVKPANLLLDASGQLFVADFGLALREADVGGVSGFVGTAAYTSPEQARREGHRVDARSDIFSLGVVLYEALTGRNPFKSAVFLETLLSVANLTPPRPCEVDPAIPAELERICLKAMARRSDDRYETAADMAEDLRLWLLSARSPANRSVREVAMMPRGLRAFEEGDAEGFLDLIPGPRGRDGLPEPVRFWKCRVEGEEGEEPFPVGVLYGPSGSGKSSFARAGLIPRLSPRIKVAYVEATAEETEARLVRGLLRVAPGLAAAGEPDEEGPAELAELIRGLRRGKGLKPEEKVLIVLDQFEQWLSGRQDAARRVLEEALRQCDGHRVQVLLLVRDEFWMEMTRFVRALEVRLVDGGNAAVVDLFDLEHARKVLVALGRAHGRLPAPPTEIPPQGREFLDEALRGLARDGRVVCVRLVLFAELLRTKPWTPSTLRTLGGVDSIGATILDQAFSASSDHPGNRTHRHAAREVLARLLPERGEAIKGHMVARDRLVEASGYADRPAEFEELMDLLDHHLRIVTPADPDDQAASAVPPGERARFYQLSHDSLVPDLRVWLLRDRQQTMTGRAELRLQEFASLWSEDRKASFLPTTWEWLVLVLLTSPGRRTEPQARMMRAAGLHHARTGAMLAVLLAAIGLFGWWKHGEFQARSLVASLRTAEIEQVPKLAREIRPYRRWAGPMLVREIHSSPSSGRAALHARLALLADDPGQADELADRLVDPGLPPVAVLTIRDALATHGHRLADGLWAVARDRRRAEPCRFRASIALAAFDPPPGRSSLASWVEVAPSLADALVRSVDESPRDYASLVGAVKPVGSILVPRLIELYRGPDNGRRSLAASLIVDMAHDDPATLAGLMLHAEPDGFAKFLSEVARHRSTVLPIFRRAVKPPVAAPGQADALAVGQSRGRAAIALIHLGDADSAWPAYRFAPDPNTRTFLIHMGERYGVPLPSLIGRLRVEKDPLTLRGLLMAIGEHSDLASSAGTAREGTTAFLEHPDPGVLGAAEWLIRRIPGEPPVPRAFVPPSPHRSWYVTREGHVMVIIDARKVPGIERAFAIASKETDIGQMRQFSADYWFNEQVTEDFLHSPANVVTWPKAIDYCQWMSRQEGIPDDQACYPRDGANGRERLPSANLARTGFRLPTAAEFSYACRAGTSTDRYFGDDVTPIKRYARFGEGVKLIAVGSLLPNDFGLFDMNGNVSEWTCDLSNGGKVFTAGGGYISFPKQLTSDQVGATVPDLEYNAYGFRIARTIELDDRGRPK